MEERKDQPPAQDIDEPAPCPCGSREHKPLRIGERISPSGGGIGGVYVCPAETEYGLGGVL